MNDSAHATHSFSSTDLSIQASHLASRHGLGGRSSNLYVTVTMRPRRSWQLFWRTRPTDVAERVTLDVTVADTPGAWGGFEAAPFREETARLKVPLPEMQRVPGLRGWVASPSRLPERYRVRYRLKLTYRGESFAVSGELEVVAHHPDDVRYEDSGISLP